MQKNSELQSTGLQRRIAEEWMSNSEGWAFNDERAGDTAWRLRDYLRALRNRFWLIAGIVTLVTLITGVYMISRPDLFEAEAEVQVDLENTSNAVGSAKTASVIVNNPMNDPAYLGTQLQILGGPRLLQRVIKTLDLEHNPAIVVADKKHNTWAEFKHFLNLDGNRAYESDQNIPNELPITANLPTTISPEEMTEAARLAPIVTALQENLTTEPVKEARLPNKTTRLINISFQNTNPLISAKVVNTLADTYVLSNLEVISVANQTTSEFLQKQISDLQTKIRGGEERLIEYSKSRQILSLDPSQNTTVERLIGLNQQLLQAENERKTAESAYRASVAPGAAAALAESNYSQIPGVETTASGLIGKAESRLAELRQKRAELLVENTEQWPEVKQIDEQITVLENQVKESRSRAAAIVTTNLETRYRQALSREQALSTALAQQRTETVAQNEAAINYRIIQQEIETNKSLLDSLLQRSKQTDISAAGLQNNIHVTNYAVTPTKPFGPRRLLNTSLALILSLVFASGLALLLEFLDDTIRTPADVEKTLGLTTLSLVPTVKGSSRSHLLIASETKLLSSGNNQSRAVHNNQDLLAEAYRHLRASMLLSVTESPPKTLLVTSSQANEGKTTTTVNTAISLGQTGASVLLIDADMHRPSLDSIFYLENNHGLSTILQGNLDEGEILNLIERTEDDGVSVLTAGPTPKNPTELLCRDQMRQLLEVLKPHFNYIIIDSPPIMSFTDSVVISSLVDGVLLVVRGSKIPREIVRCSTEILSRVGANIFGVILNNVTPAPNDYFYFQRYKGRY